MCLKHRTHIHLFVLFSSHLSFNFFRRKKKKECDKYYLVLSKRGEGRSFDLKRKVRQSEKVRGYIKGGEICFVELINLRDSILNFLLRTQAFKCVAPLSLLFPFIFEFLCFGKKKKNKTTVINITCSEAQVKVSVIKPRYIFLKFNCEIQRIN